MTHLEDGTRALPSYQHLHQLYPTMVSAKFQDQFRLNCRIPSLPIKFVAAEAGFFPPGPCVVFADMVKYGELHAQL
jgi:hypothetical protein